MLADQEFCILYLAAELQYNQIGWLEYEIFARFQPNRGNCSFNLARQFILDRFILNGKMKPLLNDFFFRI